MEEQLKMLLSHMLIIHALICALIAIHMIIYAHIALSSLCDNIVLPTLESFLRIEALGGRLLSTSPMACHARRRSGLYALMFSSPLLRFSM